MSFPVNRRGFNEAKRVSIRSCPSPIMHIHEIIRPSVEADYTDYQNNPDNCRGRFIGPQWIFQYPDYCVKGHYRPFLGNYPQGWGVIEE
jgi:hypothetical protein